MYPIVGRKIFVREVLFGMHSLVTVILDVQTVVNLFYEALVQQH